MKGPRTWREARLEMRVEVDELELDAADLELVRRAQERDRAGFVKRFWDQLGDLIAPDPATLAQAALAAAKETP